MPTDPLPRRAVTKFHGPSPFDLRQREAYLRWREFKLAGCPVDPRALVVEIRDPSSLTRGEKQAVLSACRKANMAIYACPGLGPDDPKSALRRLGRQFGLERLDRNLCADEDGIASLRVVEGGRPQEYIPYSNRPIRWHTDGYYNPPGQQIRGFILHCVCDAASGGASRLLDPEIVYMATRDQDPDYIRALMQPGAMTIPANLEGDAVLRSTQSGPVFSLNPADGSLHMRYTARTRSIEWAGDSLTREAVAFLEQLLNSELPYIYNWRLAPGQGVICNNVLHSREAFADDPTGAKARLFLRARYYDRIAQAAPP